MAHAASVYTPDALVVPTDEHGRQVFRLDRLALANGYHHDGAHEAMADVVATMYMARLIRNRTPDIWKAMDRAATKNAVKKLCGDGIAILANRNLFGAPLFLACHALRPESQRCRAARGVRPVFSTPTIIVASLPRS